jgi:hypothetical protein
VGYQVALDVVPDALLAATAAPADPVALRRLIARRTAGDLARLAAWVAASSRAMLPSATPGAWSPR